MLRRACACPAKPAGMKHAKPVDLALLDAEAGALFFAGVPAADFDPRAGAFFDAERAALLPPNPRQAGAARGKTAPGQHARETALSKTEAAARGSMQASGRDVLIVSPGRAPEWQGGGTRERFARGGADRARVGGSYVELASSDTAIPAPLHRSSGAPVATV